MTSVMNEKGTGSASASCISRSFHRMVFRSRRAGVPVFNRPRVRPISERSPLNPSAGGSPARPLESSDPNMNQSVQERTGGQHTAPEAYSRPSVSRTPFISEESTNESRHTGFYDLKIGNLGQELLHRKSIELPVRLCSGSPDSRSLFAIVHAELDTATISRSTHQPIERVDFANQVSLAEPANAGLQDITPIVSARWVTNAVFAPMRAEAAAASVPA